MLFLCFGQTERQTGRRMDRTDTGKTICPPSFDVGAQKEKKVVFCNFLKGFLFRAIKIRDL